MNRFASAALLLAALACAAAQLIPPSITIDEPAEPTTFEKVKWPSARVFRRAALLSHPTSARAIDASALLAHAIALKRSQTYTITWKTTGNIANVSANVTGVRVVLVVDALGPLPIGAPVAHVISQRSPFSGTLLYSVPPWLPSRPDYAVVVLLASNLDGRSEAVAVAGDELLPSVPLASKKCGAFTAPEFCVPRADCRGLVCKPAPPSPALANDAVYGAVDYVETMADLTADPPTLDIALRYIIRARRPRRPRLGETRQAFTTQLAVTAIQGRSDRIPIVPNLSVQLSENAISSDGTWSGSLELVWGRVPYPSAAPGGPIVEPGPLCRSRWRDGSKVKRPTPDASWDVPGLGPLGARLRRPGLSRAAPAEGPPLAAPGPGLGLEENSTLAAGGGTESGAGVFQRSPWLAAVIAVGGAALIFAGVAAAVLARRRRRVRGGAGGAASVAVALDPEDKAQRGFWGASPSRGPPQSPAASPASAPSPARHSAVGYETTGRAGRRPLQRAPSGEAAPRLARERETFDDIVAVAEPPAPAAGVPAKAASPPASPARKAAPAPEHPAEQAPGSPLAAPAPAPAAASASAPASPPQSRPLSRRRRSRERVESPPPQPAARERAGLSSSSGASGAGATGEADYDADLERERVESESVSGETTVNEAPPAPLPRAASPPPRPPLPPRPGPRTRPSHPGARAGRPPAGAAAGRPAAPRGAGADVADVAAAAASDDDAAPDRDGASGGAPGGGGGGGCTPALRGGPPGAEVRDGVLYVRPAPIPLPPSSHPLPPAPWGPSEELMAAGRSCRRGRASRGPPAGPGGRLAVARAPAGAPSSSSAPPAAAGPARPRPRPRLPRRLPRPRRAGAVDVDGTGAAPRAAAGAALGAAPVPRAGSFHAPPRGGAVGGPRSASASRAPAPSLFAPHSAGSRR
eukprot:tig00000241_g20988.t1